MSDYEEKLIFRPASWKLEDTNARIARAYEAANEKREHKYPSLAGALMGELEVACQEIRKLKQKLPVSPTKAGELAPCPFCEEDQPTHEVGDYPTEHYIYCDSCGAKGPVCRSEELARGAWNGWTL